MAFLGTIIHDKQDTRPQTESFEASLTPAAATASPTPLWDTVFANSLSTAVGYAWCVLKDGKTVATGSKYARTTVDGQELFSPNTRLNIASVSKPITAVAIMKVLKVESNPTAVDQDFFPLIKQQFPGVHNGAAKFKGVTVRNLLEMRSGLSPPSGINDVFFNGMNLWDYLNKYLNETVVGSKDPPKYSNSNFAILQAIVDCVMGHANSDPQKPDYFVTYVTENILIPMGIDPNVFNTFPDPAATAALSYANTSDTSHGFHWATIPNVGAGGWLSNVDELIKFMVGLRKNTVLDQPTTDLMLNGQLGWYMWSGTYGKYFQHNGILQTGSSQGLLTGAVRLSNDYDCIVLCNSWHLSTQIIEMIVNAFEQRN